MVFVQRKRARNMIAREFFIGARVHPHRAISPGAGLIDSHQFRTWNPRLPRNLLATIYSFANRRQKRERDKNEPFSNRAQFHRSPFYAAGRPARRPGGLWWQVIRSIRPP